MGGQAFDRFIAIDWSGGKRRLHPTIEVAECLPGHAAPTRVVPPQGIWSREDVLAYLQALARQQVRALIGFDFAFAPPFDKQASCYLPGTRAPATAAEFWAFVDAGAPDEDLGAAQLIEGPLSSHFWFGQKCGDRAPFVRLRECEERARQQGLGTPSSVFVCMGPSQVGKASFAGMRVLHRLRSSNVTIWPFDPLPAHGPVAVEIFPRLFIRHAGLGVGKLTQHEPLNMALAKLGSAPVPATLPLSADLTDALISSAGLRHIAGDLGFWRPSALTPDIARTEGWIFGVS